MGKDKAARKSVKKKATKKKKPAAAPAPDPLEGYQRVAVQNRGPLQVELWRNASDGTFKFKTDTGVSLPIQNHQLSLLSLLFKDVVDMGGTYYPI